MSRFSRRAVTSALASAAVATPYLARGQSSYPERPIKLVVPFAAGGGADYIARLMAPKLAEGLRQPVVIDNRPGAGTSIASDIVAKASPDGYTLLQVNRDMTINPSAYASLPYDTLKAFAWVGKTVDGPFVLAANPALPVRTLDELVALAKSQPGKIAWGNPSVGGIAHLSVEALVRRIGIELLQVPYKGAGPALAAAVSGEVSIALGSLTAALGTVRDGRIRALVIGAEQRSPLLPEVPTCAEAGGGDTILPTYVGLAAPAGTPATIVERLNIEMKRVLESPEMAEKIIQSGFMPAYSTPDQFGATIATDVAHFAKLVKSIGLTPQ